MVPHDMNENQVAGTDRSDLVYEIARDHRLVPTDESRSTLGPWAHGELRQVRRPINVQRQFPALPPRDGAILQIERREFPDSKQSRVDSQEQPE